MQTKTYVNCPTCNSNRISGILGQVCPQCLGVGIVAVKTQDILADFAAIKQECKTCKHWEREFIPDFPSPDIKTTIGRCSMVVHTTYWDSVDVVQGEVTDEKMGGQNVYTHEGFGCVNYEQAAQPNEIDEEIDSRDMLRAVESFKSDIKALMAKYGFSIRSRTGYAGSDETPYQIDELEIKGLLWNAETFHEIITEAFGVVCLPEQ